MLQSTILSSPQHDVLQRVYLLLVVVVAKIRVCESTGKKRKGWVSPRICGDDQNTRKVLIVD